MAISNTEKVGLSEQFIQFLKDNQADLLAKGLDVAAWITEVTGQKDSAVKELTKQDDMEAAKRAQTKVADTAVEKLYDSTSTKIDATVGVLGKKTPLAKQLSQLRVNANKQFSKKKDGGGDK